MKRTFALVLAAMMLMAVLLSGCGDNSGSSVASGAGGVTTGDAANTDPDSPYANLDLSQAGNIITYVVGSEPNAIAEVIELVNEKTKAAINTTMEIYFIPTSELTTKYPLVMAGGDEIDLIYTANHAYYREQVDKGGFRELDMDFIQKYLPQTYSVLPESAWKETYINGKIYMVPRNTASIFPDRGPIIDMDVAGKYGYTADSFHTWDDFDQFLMAVGANEVPNGKYAFHASSVANMYDIGLIYRFNLINNQASDYMYYSQLADPTFSNPFFLYTSGQYKTYVMDMVKYAEAGIWPSDAIANTNGITAMFQNGQTVTAYNNYYNGINTLQGFRERGINAEMVDIFPEGYRALRDSYLGDGMAIPSFCSKPERAAVLLDFIKNDFETYMLLAGGIEGRHYIYDEVSNTVEPGPEAADYQFDGWAWGIRHQNFPWPKTDDPYINAANEELKANQIADEEWPYWGFNFDYNPVSAEWAVISALVTEYGTSFNLGMFGEDTEEIYDEFVQKLREGGLEKYEAEWNRQRDEFLASK